MNIHRLKSWPEQFEAVRLGKKTAEFRIDDRGYAVGDLLELHRAVQMRHPDGPDTWEEEAEVNGNDLIALITHITRGPDFGIPDGYAVLSIQRAFVR